MKTKTKRVLALIGAILATIAIVLFAVLGTQNSVFAAEGDDTTVPNMLKNGGFATNESPVTEWDSSNYQNGFINNWSINNMNNKTSWEMTWESGKLTVTAGSDMTTLPTSVFIAQTVNITTAGSYTLSYCSTDEDMFVGAIISGDNGGTFIQIIKNNWTYKGLTGSTHVWYYTFSITGAAFLGNHTIRIAFFGGSGQTQNVCTGIKLEAGTTSTAPEGLEGDNAQYQAGYEAGYQAGYEIGEDHGYASGSTAGFNNGYAAGRTEGEQIGYENGHQDGYDEGLQAGSGEAYEQGKQDGYNQGYTIGKDAGLAEQLGNPLTAFVQPVQKFLSIELFGTLSIGELLSTMLFIFIGLIIIKMFAGG